MGRPGLLERAARRLRARVCRGACGGLCNRHQPSTHDKADKPTQPKQTQLLNPAPTQIPPSQKGSSSPSATPTTQTRKSAPRPWQTPRRRRWVAFDPKCPPLNKRGIWPTGRGAVVGHPPPKTSPPPNPPQHTPQKYPPKHPPKPLPPPKVVVPHRAAVKVEAASASSSYVILNERADAATRVVVHRLGPGGAAPGGPLGEGEVMAFDEAVYSLSGGGEGCCLLGPFGALFEAFRRLPPLPLPAQVDPLGARPPTPPKTNKFDRAV